MDRQVAAVRAALAKDEKWREVPVTPVLLFISAENWSLLNFRPLRFGEVYVLWGKALGKLLRTERRGPSVLWYVGIQIEVEGKDKPALVGEVVYMAAGAPDA